MPPLPTGALDARRGARLVVSLIWLTWGISALAAGLAPATPAAWDRRPAALLRGFEPSHHELTEARIAPPAAIRVEATRNPEAPTLGHAFTRRDVARDRPQPPCEAAARRGDVATRRVREDLAWCRARPPPAPGSATSST